MAHLRLHNIQKTYKDGTKAVQGISFEVQDREAVFLLGPSGAGKTTTLRLVAGLEDLDGGRIEIGGADLSSAVPRERNVAMVYDKHSLFPHLTVRENLAYPLRIRKMAEQAMAERISSVSEILQIEEQLDKMPGQLSGGQQQRVAIGRALVREADVFLLDEPISHLDAQLRARMRVEFKRLQRDFNATMLYVSHDQLEAMTMADRIVLINKGKIEQIGTPQDMFDKPETLFAATFLGEPAMNSIPVQLTDTGGIHGLQLGSTILPIDSGWITSARNQSALASEMVLGVRPQHLKLTQATEQATDVVHGVIFAVEILGSRVVFDIELEGNLIRVMTSVDVARNFPSKIGSPIGVRMDPDYFYLFDKGDGSNIIQAKFTTKTVG